MALDDPTTATLVGTLIAIMAVVTYLELRYLRKKSKNRRIRESRRSEKLPDDAHNALITTKAILTAMDRGGIRSPETVALMEEAQLAYDRHNYRVTIETTQRAKARLMALKAEQAAKGDLAKIDVPLSSSAKEEPTTKERLQKEFPAGFAQARFAMGLAESSVSGARAGGREVVQAEQLLVLAKDRFEAQDYEGALKNARLAQRSVDSRKVEVIAPSPRLPSSGPTPAATGSVCMTCGAPLKVDDSFCRKCGTKIGPQTCSACGADLAADDAFCRKCGTRIA